MTIKHPSIEQIQIALCAHGFKVVVDGIYGPQTERAIIEFKRRNGLKARAYIGPITLEKLFDNEITSDLPSDTHLIPWVNELGKYLGRHEEDPILAEWLMSDGGTVGDPDDIPWCGDAIHTAIRNSLPNEPFTGAVKANPYLAKNWCDFGLPDTEIRYGSILSFWRKKPTSMYGHVAVAIGYDRLLKRIRIRGGNQNDRLTDTWISESRLRKGGIRVPRTFRDLPPIPQMNSRGAVISTNEA